MAMQAKQRGTMVVARRSGCGRRQEGRRAPLGQGRDHHGGSWTGERPEAAAHEEPPAMARCRVFRGDEAKKWSMAPA
jgi:hypothetical protein